MRNDIITLRLTKEDKRFLQKFCKQGRVQAQEYNRAQILLAMHRQKWSKQEIAELLHVARSTINRIAKHYLEEGLEAALYDKPRSGRPIEHGEETRSHVVALACSEAPKGRECWSIELLREALQEQMKGKSISEESVRLILKDHQLKPWRKKNVVHRETRFGVPHPDVSSAGALRQAL